MSSRSVRQCKKDVRSKYTAFVKDREKLPRCLRKKQEELNEESDRRKEDSRREQQNEEEQRLTQLLERQQVYERKCLKEKHEAELDMAKRKLEMEKDARFTRANLPLDPEIKNYAIQRNTNRLGAVLKYVHHPSSWQAYPTTVGTSPTM